MRRFLISLIILFSISPSFGEDTKVVILGKALRDTDKQEYIVTTLNLIQGHSAADEYIYIGSTKGTPQRI